MTNYRIIQRTYQDGGVKYVLEKEELGGAWTSIFASADLEEVKEGKRNRINREVVSEKVIDD